MLQYVAVCCKVLQCVAVCRSVSQCVAVCYSMLQRAAACCIRCSELQCVAVCCNVDLSISLTLCLFLLSKLCFILSVAEGVKIIHDMGWLRLVGSLKLQVSFAKKPYKRDDILQKRPIILRSLLIVATS